MAGMYFSSHLEHGQGGVRGLGRARKPARLPCSRRTRWTRSAAPSAPSAAVISLVVVVLPFVPVTRTICRPRASSESRSGFSRSPMTPPMTEPSPRPASREARPAAPPTVVARRARRGRLYRRDGGLLVLIAPDAIRSRCGPRPGRRPGPRSGAARTARPRASPAGPRDRPRPSSRRRGAAAAAG